MTKQNRIRIITCAALMIAAFALQGCGAGGGVSTISGTVADINRNTITGALVHVGVHQTESLASGVYRMDGVPSGWQNVRAEAEIAGETWVGTQAAEILKNEPTMNVNIVLAPAGQTTTISGLVRNDTGNRVSGARVLLTTRTLYPSDSTGVYDGPYSSIVAVTDANGGYVMEDVPVGIDATIAASKVGFRNDEVEITTTSSTMNVNFDLVRSNLSGSPEEPLLDAIESYTLPDSLVRSSDRDAYKAIKAFTSPNYRKAIARKKTLLTRAAPAGSLIEVDMYWNAIDLNDSRDVAGYGIYRWSPSAAPSSIDFVRDPYANFYGDTDVQLTPYAEYLYAISTVDVEFLDINNNPDPNAESTLSNSLSIRPIGQVRSAYPIQAADIYGDPTFSWSLLSDSDSYTVYLYSDFPTLPLDPAYDYGSDPVTGVGNLPIWPRTSNPDESTVDGGVNFIPYSGPSLTTGHTYYWVVLAARVYETHGNGSPKRAAYSYSQIRNFTAR